MSAPRSTALHLPACSSISLTLSSKRRWWMFRYYWRLPVAVTVMHWYLNINCVLYSVSSRHRLYRLGSMPPTAISPLHIPFTVNCSATGLPWLWRVHCRFWNGHQPKVNVPKSLKKKPFKRVKTWALTNRSNRKKYYLLQPCRAWMPQNRVYIARKHQRLKWLEHSIAEGDEYVE